MRAGSVSSSGKMEVPGAVGRPGFIEGASSERRQQLFGCSLKTHEVYILSLYDPKREGILSCYRLSEMYLFCFYSTQSYAILKMDLIGYSVSKPDIIADIC